MNIPDKVKIGGIIYDVEKVPTTLILNNQACGGIIDTENCKITLNDTLGNGAIEQTFLHEIIHGICRDRKLENLFSDEETTDSLSRGLHAFIKDNLSIFKGGE